MVIAECHKGSFCIYTPKFCQEGYCSGCEIYLDKSSPNESLDERLAAMLQEAANSRS
jgi:ferredoxin